MSQQRYPSNVVDFPSYKPIAESIATMGHDGARHRAEWGTRAAGRVGGRGNADIHGGMHHEPSLRYVLRHCDSGAFLMDLDVEAGTVKVIDVPELAVPMEREDAEELAQCLAGFGIRMELFDLLGLAA